MTRHDDTHHPTDNLIGHGAGAPHAPAIDEEVVYYEGSPLLRGELGLLLIWIVVGLAIAAVPVVWFMFDTQGGGRGGPPWWVWLLVPAGMATVFVPSLWLKRNRYKITNYRIDHEFGILSTTINTLELWHVNDVRMRQGLTDRIFGVGTITVDTDDRSDPRLEIRSVAQPRPLFETLKQRVISVKRQRGVIKMDMGG